MTIKRNAAAAFVFAGMAVGAGQVHNTAGVVAELPPVTVEASRLGKTPLEIASHVEVIDKDDIDSSGAVSTVDLL